MSNLFLITEFKGTSEIKPVTFSENTGLCYDAEENSVKISPMKPYLRKVLPAGLGVVKFHLVSKIPASNGASHEQAAKSAAIAERKYAAKEAEKAKK